MNQAVRISHPEQLEFTRWTAPGETLQEQGHILQWIGDESDIPGVLSCVGSFDMSCSFNAIRLDPHPDHPELFPGSFRFEISQDGKVWEPIIREAHFPVGETGAWNFPLISARHIKLVFLSDRKNGSGSFQTAFGSFHLMVSGIVDVSVSSELDRLWVKENLTDGRSDYGWSTSLRTKREEEFILLDLGSINRVGEIRLRAKEDPETFFPSSFRISYSEDNISWHHLLEESAFLAEQGAWYSWRFLPLNIRHIRITIDEGARTREGKYISQIIELELYAEPDLLDKSSKKGGLSEPMHYASVLRSGIVRLAMDGEVREGVAVQAHDRRLRDASTENKGIVELASDGEDRGGVAVQGSDRRLKYATEDLPGIVRLARNEEERAGHVVQSNDRRLKLATEDSAGLVELAHDGEERGGVAVQANDSRLKNATEARPGIVQLAPNGSDRPNEVVQGNDRRLLDGTTERKGLMRFATLGEEAAEAAVQGNDPRLKKATTETAGLVELARDGEVKEGVAVQSNDSRLKSATEEKAGIVMLNPHGGNLKGAAIQGGDPRLSDARPPMAHEHDYAPQSHSYDSHTGYLKLEGDMGKTYESPARPPLSHAPITGKNLGEGAGVAGVGENEGVLGAGSSFGVVGYSWDEGTGVLGSSKKGPGGHFLSGSHYSLVVGGEVSGRKLKGSSLGLQVNGLARMRDSLYLASEGDGYTATLACYFPVENEDVIVPGDILVASQKEGVLKKSTDYASTGVVGVVVERASLVLNPSGDLLDQKQVGSTGVMKPAGHELVALGGIVEIQAIVEKHPIHPGDLLVTSLHSGKAEKFTGEKYAPGSLFARSLGHLASGEGRLRVILAMLLSFFHYKLCIGPGKGFFLSGFLSLKQKSHAKDFRYFKRVEPEKTTVLLRVFSTQK